MSVIGQSSEAEAAEPSSLCGAHITFYAEILLLQSEKPVGQAPLSKSGLTAFSNVVPDEPQNLLP